MTAPARHLCRLDEIPDGTARGFRLGEGPEAEQILVVRRGGRVHGWVNRCPHVGTPLNWLPDRFLSHDGRHLLCATHGALFGIEDGRCLAGPPRGSRLRPVAVRVEEGAVVLEG